MNARRRDSLYGVIFLVVLAVVVTLSIMQFRRAFDSSTPITVHSPRAGLLLSDGSDVKLRGVTIGHVDSVRATPEGADLGLAIDPDQLHLVPADAGADVVPPTLFGGKYVELTMPASGGHGTLAAHAVIDASSVTVEFNQTFGHLVTLLDAVKPSQVNAALTALSQTVDGRGAQLGQLITKLNSYLGSINPDLGTLNTDVTAARPVLDTYTGLTPNLLSTLRNVTTTSTTITDNRAALDAMLLATTGVARKTTTFVQANQRNLATALDVLATPLQTLARYSPVFPCFFAGLAGPGLTYAQDAVGGKQPGLGVLAQFIPPAADYTYPKDLPKVAADTGPDCYDLPTPPQGTKFHHTTFDVGPDPYANAAKTPGFTLPSVLQLLFGPIKGAS